MNIYYAVLVGLMLIVLVPMAIKEFIDHLKFEIRYRHWLHVTPAEEVKKGKISW